MGPERSTRKPKEKRYATKNGVRVYFEGYALAQLPAGQRWVTANHEIAEVAKVLAVQKAERLEREAREKEAQDRERALFDLLHAETKKKETPFVRELLQDYNAYAEECGNQDSTLRRYDDWAKLFSNLSLGKQMPILGDMRVAELLQGDCWKRLQVAHNRMLESYAANTVRARWTYLSSVFNYAIKSDIIRPNPLAKVKIASREQKGDLEFAEGDLGRMLKATSGNASLRAAIAASMAYGPRCQETVAVNEDSFKSGKLVFNVDTQGNEFSVWNAKQFVQGE